MKKKKPKKPKMPPTRILREGSAKFCPVCGSTYLTRYKFFKTDTDFGIRKVQGCIQPECSLYRERDK